MHRFLLALLACLVLLPACSWIPDFGVAPEPRPAPRVNATAPRPAAVAAVLARSGGNSKELASFLDTYQGRPRMLEAARFLVANLPPADRAMVSTELLRENLEYAFLARRSFPWARELSWDKFLHYVLPHRMSQEPAQAVRAELFEELAPKAAGRDARHALEAVNAWVVGQMGFKTTRRWDLGPKGLMRRGFGRCEEAVILFGAAARAVGLPVREAMAPAWQHVNDNHAWAEVWLDGKWRAVDPGKHGVSHTGNAGRAPFVLAMAYGNVTSEEETVYRRVPGATLLNVTPAYAETFEAEVAVQDAGGRPVANASVFAAVYNYGSLRPVARIQTDEQGRGSARLGAGTFLLSARRGESAAFEFVTWLPEQSRPEEPVELRLSEDAVLAGEFFLPVPGGEHATEVESLGRNASLRREEDRNEAARKARFEGFERLVETCGPAAGNATLIKTLESARGNAPELLRVLNLSEQGGPAYFHQMRAKDRVVVTAREALDSLELSRQARRGAAAMGVEYGDQMFWSLVARDRLLYEPFSLWRPGVEPVARKLFADGLQAGLRGASEFIAGLPAGEAYLLGPNLRPQDVLALDAAPREADRCVAGAALLRAAGVPAICQDEWGFVDFFDGENRAPMFWSDPDLLGRTNATARAKAYFGEPAGVLVRFFRDGENVSESMDYFRDFSLSHFTEDGRFRILEKAVHVERLEEENGLLVRIPEGRVWLMVGVRYPDGVRVQVHPVDAEAGMVSGPLEIRLDRTAAME